MAFLMPDWLNTVRSVLDHKARPAGIFFRDDDAGWANDKLYVLLDKFEQTRMPIDLAIIPIEADKGLMNELLLRWHSATQLIGLHQHGYSHNNHESQGRKCEFGLGRSKSEQKDDIQRGQEQLKQFFSSALDPIFTPPWNRCTQVTLDCLEELDFKLLSRDITATPLNSTKIIQVPVHIDWSRIMSISANSLEELGARLASQLVQNDVTGIMLHHADMNSDNLKPLTELLTMFSQHTNVQGLLLRNMLGNSKTC